MRIPKPIQSLIAISILLLLIARWQRSWPIAAIAPALLLTGLLWKSFTKILHTLWMKLAETLGFISSHILLTLVWFLLLLPLSLFARFNKKLTIRLTPPDSSNFKTRNHTYTKEDLENPW